ncbi:MAG: hypothetical protein KF799_16235 [Bdellovibrionales bacterium]|nr:hypothetical protein [Bdellovibrionales bacterium]
MILLLLCAGLVQSAVAVPLASPESLLERPIDQRVKAFAQLKDGGHKFLGQIAFDKNAALQTRWRAITTMGRLNAAAFSKEIDRALVSPEWFVRNAALIALLNDARPRAVEFSTALLADRALVVRTQAVRNIIALNAREAEPALWKALYEKHNYKGRESLWIRAHMAEALSRFSGPGKAKNFERLLLDPDTRLHKWAITGLETATGMRLSDRKEPVEVRRQKWLARLGVHEI